jgi:hypothetical protein
MRAGPLAYAAPFRDGREERRMTRTAWTAVLGAAALAALYLALAVRTPVSLGFFGDDAVYATTARALAEGRGYRNLSIPGEPLQTKYPPLYPALLSLAFRARPDFPANFPLLLVPGALAGAGALALCALYWRRVLGSSPRATLALALLAALSPALLAFSRYAMSEFVYMLFASAALLCLDARAPRDGARGSTPWLLLGAALAACAVLTRTIGISLAAAAIAAPLLRRRFTDAALVAAVLLAFLLPWWSWQARAAAANGALGTAFLVGHELGYSSWLPEGPIEAVGVAVQNLLRLVFGLGWFQLALPESFVRAAIAQGGARLVLLHAVCWSTFACIAWGFVRSARGGLRTLHFYAAIYGAMILVWTFSPYRFLVPWTPFLLFFAASGARDALVALRNERARRAAGALAYGAVLALFLAEAARIASRDEHLYYAREVSVDWTELRDVERFVREHTLPEEIIASAHPELLFLTTGRRGHYFWPESDPAAFEYDPARSFGRFTILPVAEEARARMEDVLARLGPVYREAGIGWYVEWTMLPSTQSFAAAIAKRPGWFEQRYRTPLRSFTIHRVHIPPGAR